MHQSGIPASIILGIAMHESGCGNSNIAKKLNNQFGMKGSSTSVYFKNKKKVTTPYKAYDSVLDSFDDFARVIREKKKFAGLADQLYSTDYVAWVKGIERSGYASSKTWGKQVLALITKYNLNAFDNKRDSTEFVELPVQNQQ
jgi:flagellum-specific peptidoglycan hydrolase FlgJ